VRKKASSLPEKQRSLNQIPQIGEALAAVEARADDDSVGALLMAVVELSRISGVDPETALRAAALRHRDEERAAELANQ
jgi:hypothetical protein